MSMPISRIACTEWGVGGWSSSAPRPADSTRNWPRPLTAWQNSPSAIGLRQTLPVHKKRMVFIKNRVVKGGSPEASRQSEIMASCQSDEWGAPAAGYENGSSPGKSLTFPLIFHQLRKEVFKLLIVGIQMQAGLGNQHRVIRALATQQQIDVAINGFGRIRTNGVALAKREVGSQIHPRAFVRSLRVLGTPGIKAGEGGAQFGKAFAGVRIFGKRFVALVIVQVFAEAVFVRKIANVLERGFFIEPAAQHFVGEFFPISLVRGNGLAGNFRERLAVQLKYEAVRREIGIHPVERVTFFDENFASGIVVEDFLDEQRVDLHHGNLAAHLDATIHRAHVLAGLELAEFPAACEVGGVF